MKNLLAIIFFLSFSCYFAQNKKVDSLKQAIASQKIDTLKIKSLNDLGWELMHTNTDTSITLATAALRLSKKIGWKKGMAGSYNNLGVYYSIKGDRSKALELYLRSLKLEEELNNKKGIAMRLGNIGMVYKEQNNYYSALDCYRRAIKIDEELDLKKDMADNHIRMGIVYNERSDFLKAMDHFISGLKLYEKLNNKDGIALSEGNIGNIYAAQADYPKALNYYTRLLKLSEELDNKGYQALALGNIGSVYISQADLSRQHGDMMSVDSDYAKALSFYRQSLSIHEELGDKSGIARDLGNIGSVYFDRENFDQALDHYKRALIINKEMGNKENAVNNTGNIGLVYIALKKYKEAHIYLFDALAISAEINSINYLSVNYSMLSNLYEKSNVLLPDSANGKLLSKEEMRLRALYYLKKHMAIRDIIFNEDNRNQLTRKEMNYDFEKRELAAKSDQYIKDARAAEEKQKQRIILFFVIGGLVLVMVFSVFLYKRFRITRKQKQIIEQQKLLVEEHQKEIVDSIYYAKRIQKAHLPTEKYIDKNLDRLKK